MADSKFIKKFLEENEPKLDLSRIVIAPSGEKLTVNVGFGVEFFALSSEHRQSQLDEFYYMTKLLNVSWSDFISMPIFYRKYLLNKWIEENQTK